MKNKRKNSQVWFNIVVGLTAILFIGIVTVAIKSSGAATGGGNYSLPPVLFPSVLGFY